MHSMCKLVCLCVLISHNNQVKTYELPSTMPLSGTKALVHADTTRICYTRRRRAQFRVR